MQSHTPGPWKYTGQHYNDHGGKYHEIVGQDGKTICGETGGPYSSEDARLIAAAPDLLAALETIDEWLMEGYNNEDAENENYNIMFRKALKSTRAAIAKATQE